MIKNIFIGIIVLFLLNSCHAGRFFVWNVVDQDDYKKFYNVEIKKGTTTFNFDVNTQKTNLNLPQNIHGKKRHFTFNEALIKDKTIAFLIIKNDSILFEKYFYDYDKSSIQASFSISKSFISALIGIAINDGKINSVQDPITKYLSFLEKKEFQNITIQHLLDMQSGILSKKDFLNPFGQMVKLYYGKNLKKYMHNLKVDKNPGETFDYSNVNSQLLALILENVTGQKLTKNLEEKIWKPLGMEYNAQWSVDSKKHQTVKAFCCLNASARDYAKLGRLYLQQGKWNGKQIVPKKWIEKSTTFKTAKNSFRYTNHWKHVVNYEVITDTTKYPDLYENGGYFIDKNNIKRDFIIHPNPAFYAVGILGQFIYVHPEKNIIIVRLGKQDKEFDWENLFKEIVEMN